MDWRHKAICRDEDPELFFPVGNSGPAIAQIADEKQTIVRLVASGFGVAIVPRWASKTAVSGVRYIALVLDNLEGVEMLPLAAAWVRGTRDPAREALMAALTTNLAIYGLDA